MLEVISRAHAELPIWFQLLITAAIVAFCVVIGPLMWNFFFPRKSTKNAQ